MDLSILFNVPLTIESVSPKWTMDRVSLVISFAIGALEQMRARFTLLGFKSRRISFVISLTTPTELSMMFQLVRAVTFNAFCSLNPARQGGVTPFPAILTKQDARVHVCTSDGGDEVSNVKTPVNEHFRILTALNVPNVNPN